MGVGWALVAWIAPAGVVRGRASLPGAAARVLLPLAMALILAARPGPAAAQSLDTLLLHPDHPVWSTPAPPVFDVRFETSRGEFVIRVERALAPGGADRFYNLVRHGFFNDTRFYRVVPDFVVQFGVSGDPAVTAAWAGRELEDDPVVGTNVRGAVAYATTGPDTRLTQVYICLVDLTRLDDDGFSPFGNVVAGMEVVDALYGGYGEDAVGGMRAGRQGPMLQGGNAYLDREFPRMDRIVRAWVEVIGRG